MRPITPEELREWCAKARTKPVPLSEAIEMLQRAADALETERYWRLDEGHS